MMKRIRSFWFDVSVTTSFLPSFLLFPIRISALVSWLDRLGNMKAFEKRAGSWWKLTLKLMILMKRKRGRESSFWSYLDSKAYSWPFHSPWHKFDQWWIQIHPNLLIWQCPLLEFGWTWNRIRSFSVAKDFFSSKSLLARPIGRWKFFKILPLCPFPLGSEKI